MESTSFRSLARSRNRSCWLLLSAALSWSLAGPAPSGAADRTALGELFTAPNCIFCPSAVDGVLELEEVFTPEQFVPISFYKYSDLYSVPEGLIRADMYDAWAVPWFVVDGVLQQYGGFEDQSMFSWYLPLIEERLETKSPLVMSAAYGVAGDEVTVSVAAEVDQRLNPGQRQMDFFVCQDGVIGLPNLVLRVLEPEPFDLAMNGETGQFERQFTLDPAWTTEALRVVVIVQDLVSLEVLQATQAVYEATSAAGDMPAQEAVILGPASPNPFNPGTTIGFSLVRGGTVRLEVFALDGRRVRTLTEQYYQAGDHEVTWHGDDQAGSPVASGTYLYRLECGDVARTGRMTLLK